MKDGFAFHLGLIFVSAVVTDFAHRFVGITLKRRKNANHRAQELEN
jgi:hypothetical protein